MRKWTLSNAHHSKTDNFPRQFSLTSFPDTRSVISPSRWILPFNNRRESKRKTMEQPYLMRAVPSSIANLEKVGGITSDYRRWMDNSRQYKICGSLSTDIIPPLFLSLSLSGVYTRSLARVLRATRSLVPFRRCYRTSGRVYMCLWRRRAEERERERGRKEEEEEKKKPSCLSLISSCEVGAIKAAVPW